MEVQGSLGRQIQGISQQPPAVRLDGQCTDMVNMLPDIVDGTKTRMGSKHIARLMATGDDTMHTHHYRRGDGNEEYFFVTKQGALPQIFDKQGRLCGLTSLNTPLTYLSGITLPREDLQMLTIADVTFLLNRKKVVQARADNSPALGSTAIVFSAFGQYAVTYKIVINGAVAASYTTANGTNDADVKTIKTEWIAEQLYTSLQSWAGLVDYTHSRDGTCIYLTRTSGDTSWTITTEDGAKGKDLVAIKYKVTSTDLLPSRAPVGYKVQVWPTGSKPESRYWLEAEAKEGNLVSWKETIGANILLGFDKATMPYIIERTTIDSGGIAQFTIRQGDWEDRQVGDDLTNPMPSFVDATTPQTIGSMFMVQNRLCFTAGEAVIGSRTSFFFDFFRQTAVAAVATDPFDVYSDASEVYQLRHAVILDGDTVLFSASSQFILPGDRPITKETALLRPTTTFEVNTNVRPVATGESIMFATTEGAYSSIREFYTDSYSDTKKAQPITSHVNKLIQGSITQMVASSNINRLFVMTNRDKNIVYVYDWLWQGTDKVQSAWHKWVYPLSDKVRSIFYSRNTLYLLIDRGTSGLYLESYDMGDELESGLTDRVRMDRQSELTFTYNPAEENWTSGVLPYTPTELSLLDCVITTGWEGYVGGAFLFDYNQDNTLTTTFDLNDTAVGTAKARVGQLYSSEFEPTPVVIKDSRDRVSYIDVPVVGLVHLNLDKYPDFTVEITNTKSGKTRTAFATNRRGGARNNIVGFVQPAEGVFKFPLRALSTDATYRIISQAPHTLQLRDIEWEGSYNQSKRRV